MSTRPPRAIPRTTKRRRRVTLAGHHTEVLIVVAAVLVYIALVAHGRSRGIVWPTINSTPAAHAR